MNKVSVGYQDIFTISAEKSLEVWTSIDLDSELSIMNKTVRKKTKKTQLLETKRSCSFKQSRCFRLMCLCVLRSSQDSYEMFVEMDKMDGDMDVKIKKKKKIKKKERLENMKKEMDIVSGRKFLSLYCICVSRLCKIRKYINVSFIVYLRRTITRSRLRNWRRDTRQASRK